MNAPLDQKQQNAVHAMQCRARALPFELHLDSNWNVILLVDGCEYSSIDAADAHLSKCEVAT